MSSRNGNSLSVFQKDILFWELLGVFLPNQFEFHINFVQISLLWPFYEHMISISYRAINCEYYFTKEMQEECFIVKQILILVSFLVALYGEQPVICFGFLNKLKVFSFRRSEYGLRPVADLFIKVLGDWPSSL